MAQEPELSSKSAYARHRGVTPSLVTQWTQAGRIKIVDGKVDIAASDQMLAESYDPRGGKRQKIGGSGILPAADAGAGQTGAAAGTLGPAAVPVQQDTYTRVRTHREAYRAKTEEVEYREKVGELIERSRMDRALADGLGPILAALDSLPARLGPLLAAETDVRRVQNIMDDAITTIRQDMADTLRQMATGQGNEAIGHAL